MRLWCGKIKYANNKERGDLIRAPIPVPPWVMNTERLSVGRMKTVGRGALRDSTSPFAFLHFIQCQTEPSILTNNKERGTFLLRKSKVWRKLASVKQ